MRTDKNEMLDNLRQSKEFCMVTITACKKILAESENVTVKTAVSILAGLAEIKRVVEDYYGTI